MKYEYYKRDIAGSYTYYRRRVDGNVWAMYRKDNNKWDEAILADWKNCTPDQIYSLEKASKKELFMVCL